jgi:tetratricopeptide (TPR) repeat protein
VWREKQVGIERVEKTVFISYRRTNVPWALNVYQNLTHTGYDVFFDFEGVGAGDFESVILGNIAARAHFLVLLTPSALERCGEPGDWLRREIEAAIDSKRNIVPLMLEGFSFDTPQIASQLTGTLALLRNYNGIGMPAEYFLAAMDKLRNKYLNVPLTAVLQPASPLAQQIATEQKAAADEAPPVREEELTAQQYFERGYASPDFDEQIRFYSEAIKLKSDYGLAYGNRGFARLEKGDPDGALGDLNEAIRLGSDIADVYNNRGRARLAKDDLAGALSDYDTAIQLQPDYFFACYNRAILREGQGDFEGALADYAEAIRLKPDYAEAYNNRGVARDAKGDFEGALADYAEAIRLKPDYALAYYNRGVARDAKGDFEGALADYAETIRLKPDYALAYYNRGLLFRKMNQNAATVADFQQYLALGGGERHGNTEKVEGWIRELQEKLETGAG